MSTRSSILQQRPFKVLHRAASTSPLLNLWPSPPPSQPPSLNDPAHRPGKTSMSTRSFSHSRREQFLWAVNNGIRFSTRTASSSRQRGYDAMKSNRAMVAVGRYSCSSSHQQERVRCSNACSMAAIGSLEGKTARWRIYGLTLITVRFLAVPSAETSAGKPSQRLCYGTLLTRR